MITQSPNGNLFADNNEMSYIIQPTFLIQKKIGGSFGKMLTSEKLRRAEATLSNMQHEILDGIKPMLNEITALSRIRSKDAAIKIWKYAHEIRGLAGSAQRKYLGEICNIICHYLNDVEDDNFRPDPNLITVLSVSAVHSSRDDADSDPETAIMVDECRNAAFIQKQREGRGA